VYDGLALAIMIASLAAAAWCGIAALRDRWLDLTHLGLLALVELAVLVQAVIAVVRIAGGAEPAEFGTFVGYLIVAVLTVPATVGLAFAEKTRWGAAIAGAGAFTLAVLVLRLGQVWA
jgi:hypothetical protein